jgi:hypothetical protein
MSRKKRKKAPRKLRTQQPSPMRSDRTGIWRRSSLIVKTVSGLVLGAAGLIGGYAAVKPRVLIEPPQVLVDPKNPYDSPFTIVNDGYFSLYKIDIDCIPATIAANEVARASPDNPSEIKASTKRPALSLNELDAGDRRPFVCDIFKELESPNMTIIGVELEVLIQAAPIKWWADFVYWKKELFQADADGDKFRWQTLPVGREPHFPDASMRMRIVPGE